jgi:DNA-binding transcriptional ArsR family regulator
MKSQKGKTNRNRILAELKQQPLTFSKIKQKLDLSGKNLSRHLNSLRSEGIVKREIQGKYIVYVLNEPKAILQLRKELISHLLDVTSIYGSALREDTWLIFQQFLNSLKTSIEEPEEKAKLTMVFTRQIEIPEGFKGTIKIPISKPHEKVEFKKSKK